MKVVQVIIPRLSADLPWFWDIGSLPKFLYTVAHKSAVLFLAKLRYVGIILINSGFG